MSIALEKGLKTVLTGTATVYPRLPQSPSFPLVRYQLIYVDRTLAVDATNVGPTEAGLQLDCMAETYEGAKALADSVRTALHGYTGSWGTLTAHLVKLQTENDFEDIDGDGITHWVSQRYQVWTDMD